MNDWIQLNDYELIFKGRKNRQGGDVGLYIKENLNYKVRSDLSISDEDTIESLFTELVNENS